MYECAACHMAWTQTSNPSGNSPCDAHTAALTVNHLVCASLFGTVSDWQHVAMYVCGRSMCRKSLGTAPATNLQQVQTQAASC